MNQFIEQMETRTMFAGTTAKVMVSVDSLGTLTVTGTGGADSVVVKENLGAVSVTSSGVGIGTFGNIKKIIVKGGVGNDTLTYSGNTQGAIIYGQDGGDTVYVTDPTMATSTTSPFSQVFGGGGADKITVYNGVGTVVRGEAGGDTITANAGRNLKLYGDADNDTIVCQTAVSSSYIYRNSTDKVTNFGSGNLVVLV